MVVGEYKGGGEGAEATIAGCCRRGTVGGCRDSSCTRRFAEGHLLGIGKVDDAFSEGGRCRQAEAMIGGRRLVLGYHFSARCTLCSEVVK